MSEPVIYGHADVIGVAGEIIRATRSRGEIPRLGWLYRPLWQELRRAPELHRLSAVELSDSEYASPCSWPAPAIVILGVPIFPSDEAHPELEWFFGDDEAAAEAWQRRAR